MSIITWVYGITTVKERRNSTLPKTILSLKASGFDTPTLFIDDEGDSYSWKMQFGLNCISRHPIIKGWGNWILALCELYIRSPTAGRYVLFQDDIVVVRNLRQYLERHPFKPKTYWNLITASQNQKSASARPHGWFGVSKRGLGAQGLVFDREGVISIITSGVVVKHPQDKRCGTRKIDDTVVQALKGYKELCHSPSLISHMKVKSTAAMMHDGQPHAPSFPGEAFDALTLIKK